MQVLENNTLFTEVSAEESAMVSGGDAAFIDVNTAQIVFALGAFTYTKLLTGSEELAFDVLKEQYNRAFSSFIFP